MDGLNDCEEDNLLHTEKTKYDSDGDGIPDDLEVRFGLNPLDPQDSGQSLGVDGMTNLQKIKANLPILQTLNASLRSLAYRYETIPQANGCLTVKVDNIPLVDSSSGNAIRIYVFEKTVQGTSALRTIPLVIESMTRTADGESVVYEYQPGDASVWSVQQ
jgi:hypothetical protein